MEMFPLLVLLAIYCVVIVFQRGPVALYGSDKRLVANSRLMV